MPEFTFRDRRRAKVDSALTVLAADLTGLKTQLAADRAALSVAVDAAEIATLTAKLNPLNAAIALRETAQAALQFEQAALRGSGVLLEDATWRLVAADWLWTNPADILGLLTNADPVLVALAATSQFSIVTEQTLRTARATWPVASAPPADLLDRVVALPGFTAAIMEELIGTANRLLRDRRDGSSPFDHTATLLPLRIETLFPPEEPGRIWIRVTPGRAFDHAAPYDRDSNRGREPARVLDGAERADPGAAGQSDPMAQRPGCQRRVGDVLQAHPPAAGRMAAGGLPAFPAKRPRCDQPRRQAGHRSRGARPDR